MIIEEVKTVCRAIELAYYGVDIEQVDDFTKYYNPVKKCLQDKYSPLTKPVTLRLSEDITKYINHCFGNHVIRSGKTMAYFSFDDSLEDAEKETIIDVSLKIWKQTMALLKRKGVASFTGYDIAEYDEDFKERMEKSRKEHKYTVVPDIPMIETLSHDAVRKNLEVLLTLFQYPKELSKKILEKYDTNDTDFEIDTLADFEIIDNRIYIPLSEADIYTYSTGYGTSLTPEMGLTKYIVISRNPYDYFFCSYGSSIQSCYSLNSSYGGGYGMYPMCINKGHYLVYGTDGKCNQEAILNGKKWAVPHMTFRCWGWLSKDGRLFCDRTYVGNSGHEHLYDQHFYTPIMEKFTDVTHETRKETTSLKYGDDIARYYNTYHLSTYLDSINITGKYFKLYGGHRGTIGSVKQPFNSLITVSKSITNISDTFKFDTDYTIIDGVLCNIKKCPITGLEILPEEDKSYYSKFYKEPVDSLTVITFCDGFIYLTASTENTPYDRGSDPIKVISKGDDAKLAPSVYSGKSMALTFRPSDVRKRVSLPAFKNALKELVQKDTLANNILLRVIEQDRVQFIKYKG